METRWSRAWNTQKFDLERAEAGAIRIEAVDFFFPPAARKTRAAGANQLHIIVLICLATKMGGAPKALRRTQRVSERKTHPGLSVEDVVLNGPKMQCQPPSPEAGHVLLACCCM